MSHHTIYKTNLKVDEETLIKAVYNLADKLGIRVENYVKDYYGRVTKVPVALVPSDLPRGIGFRVRNGELRIEGDAYGYRREFSKYSELVKNYINAYVTSKQIYTLYPNAVVKTNIRNEVVELEVVL